MQPDVTIQLLAMTVDPSDSSYMPSLVVVSGGDVYSDMTELASVVIRYTDTVVPLLSDIKEVKPQQSAPNFNCELNISNLVIV